MHSDWKAEFSQLIYPLRMYKKIFVDNYWELNKIFVKFRNFQVPFGIGNTAATIFVAWSS